MSNTKILPSNKWISVLLVFSCLISACTSPSDISTATPALQKLRIVNSGNQDITHLTVLFPGPTSNAEAARVEFGDIPAGETTEYQNVPAGVYRYAAYEYTLVDRVVQQAVIDWVGESPMEGLNFTYRIELDSQKEPGSQILLIEVSVDTP